MTTLTEQLAWLFKRLEELGSEYPEARDSDVREHLAEVLNYYFVWDHPIDRTEWYFSLYSEEGNDDMSEVVATFLEIAKESASKEGVNPGVERLAALQNPNIWTPERERYDAFIGHSDDPLPDAKPGTPKGHNKEQK